MRAFLVRHPEIMSISMLSDKGENLLFLGYGGISKSYYSWPNEPWLDEVDVQDRLQARRGRVRGYVDEHGRPSKLRS